MTTATDTLMVRVTVTEVWDTVHLAASPDWTVADLKREALRQATGREVDPGSYLVKFRGARVLDESRTLADLGVPDDAAMIVLPAKRLPVH